MVFVNVLLAASIVSTGLFAASEDVNGTQNIVSVDINKTSDINKTALSDREIDLLFIGFAQQKKLEEMKRKKKEDKKKILKKNAKMQKKAKVSGHKRKVFSHSTNLKIGTGDREVVQKNKINIPPIAAIEKPIEISGILCSNDKCKALTNIGLLLKGSKINNKEHVVKIDEKSVVTNKQIIMFK